MCALAYACDFLCPEAKQLPQGVKRVQSRRQSYRQVTKQETQSQHSIFLLNVTLMYLHFTVQNLWGWGCVWMDRSKRKIRNWVCAEWKTGKWGDQDRTITHQSGQREPIRWDLEGAGGVSNLRWVCWGAAGGQPGSPELGDHGPWGQGLPLARTLRRLGGLFDGDGSRGWPKWTQRAQGDPLLTQSYTDPPHLPLLLSHPLASGLLPLLLLHQVPRPHGQLSPQPAGPPAAHCSLSASVWSIGEEGSREGWEDGGRDGGKGHGEVKGKGVGVNWMVKEKHPHT